MKIILNLPKDIDLGLTEFDYKMILGVALYEKNYMSSGLAAEILGIDRSDFIINMGKYGKSIYEKSEEEIKEDMIVAERFVR
jgi:predicted HTH domain antitoxin